MILQGDCLEQLKTLPDESVDMCVTSPPYYQLRDYGMEGQIGLEDTPYIYIYKLTEVFHEVMRVLKPEGTLWVNIGDSWWGSGSRGYNFEGKLTAASELQKHSKGTLNLSNVKPLKGRNGVFKDKDMIGIPWMLAFALREDGWYLRQDIIWHKPNPMPESVKDRCTKSHEYIFLLSKKQKYYFDHEAIKEEAIWKNDKRKSCGRIAYKGKRQEHPESMGQQSFVKISNKRNKRDVWHVNTQPLKEAHFATFPEELIEPCILAGCPKDGVVLDPFFGSGTVGVVATKLSRKYIGIELNPEYIEIAKSRMDGAQLSLQGLV